MLAAVAGLATAACRTASPAPPDAGPTTAPAPAAAGGSAWEPPRILGTVADPALTEGSGLAASRTNPGLLWAHNDSGDGPFVYCLQPTGAACGTWRVTGAEARDWEDMAAGPGPEAGRSYLYLGDIGDNARGRPDVTVYRVPEPAVTPAATGSTREGAGATEPAEALRLRYPDGPHDAEALLVHPATGDLYIVAKEPSADPPVYRARAPLAPGPPAVLERVAGLRLPAAVARLELVTGGDIAPDGRRLVLATYTAGYELTLPEGAAAFDDIWTLPPVRLALAPRRQGEAIAYRLDGAAVLTISEGAGEPIAEVARVPSA